MICDKTKKHRSSVLRALKAAGVQPERIPGVKGGRIPEKEAVKVVAKHWPEVIWH